MLSGLMKKVGILFGIYAIVFGIYLLLHCRNANIIQGSIHLTDNFYFNIKDEIIYTLTILIPLVYVYVFNLTEIGEEIVKRVTICLSCVTALPIFVSNLFVWEIDLSRLYN